VFGDGEIKNTNFHAMIGYDSVRTWVQQRMVVVENFQALPGGLPFARELEFLGDALQTQMANVYMHQQTRLPDTAAEAQVAVERQLEKALHRGGEGLILRAPDALWLPKRVRSILKYKPFSDAEGTVVGYTSGRETDKGSKLLGLIGSLILDYKGKRLELAGLTNEERLFATPEMASHATDNPGVDMPKWFEGKHFNLGAIVSFKYRELSDDGIPKEARYWRKPSL
jgi:DNA ligase-1